MMAEAFAKCCRFLHRRDDIGVTLRTVGALRREGDAQAAGFGADFLKERSCRRRGRIGIARRIACGCIERGGAVAHAARDDMRDREARPAFAAIGTHRRAAACRFQPEEAAGGGRNADRAAAVAGIGERQDAGRNRRRRAARRTAGGMVEVPGIARRAIEPRLGCAGEAEFGRIALAEDDEAGLQVALGQRRIVIGLVALEQCRAIGRHRAFEQQVQVLQQEGHAAENAVGQAARDLRAGLVVVLHHDGVDLRIDRFGTEDRFFEQVAGAHIAALDQGGKAQTVIFVVVRKTAHLPASPSCVPLFRPDLTEGAGVLPMIIFRHICGLGNSLRGRLVTAWPNRPRGWRLP